jgi:DNA repair ATPase RecN
MGNVALQNNQEKRKALDAEMNAEKIQEMERHLKELNKLKRKYQLLEKKYQLLENVLDNKIFEY